MNTLLSFLGIELSPVSYKEKIISAIGGFVAISALVWMTHLAVGNAPAAVCVVASMGASAVLLFGVPHGQLSQPWPVVGGHGVSAVIGVLAARYLGHGWLASGCAVGLAIGIMHQLKCIHPPGGATALTAVIGGDAIHALGFEFVWWPVLLNAIIMVTIAVIFNAPFAWRRYPVFLAKARRPLRPHPFGRETEHEDIVKALKEMDSFVDVAETDLIALARIISREREARLLKEARKGAAESSHKA